ncbi:MAG: ATP-binding cassette domain-containing protein [Magnetococcales bacterium]|nr:ATP-binding cassette domain-containing protein [Magnetococcales bacterium]
METVIEARGLTKRYGPRTVVKGIDLTVRRGECFGLLGPNGAGKSTTLRMIQGMTPPDGGSLALFHPPLGPGDPLARARMGVVSQENSLDVDLTVGENLLVYGRYFGLREKVIRQRVEGLLEFAQLSDRRESPVRTLSGGMQRRLMLARALVASPELVVLDEPTTGLDPQARHLIWRRLRQLREAGTTLLLTTHYMEEAAQLCDRILILDQGRVLDLDSPLALIRRHVEPEVVEVRRPGGPPWRPEECEQLPGRVEVIGDACHCHLADPVQAAGLLVDRPDWEILRRPANLEDVFLRLTGRELRD